MDPDEPQTNPRLRFLSQWHKLFDTDTPPRLGLPIDQRLPYTALGGLSAGMAIGVAQGSKMSSYRFRAENAHRFPTSAKGWYQYHRNKNYAVMLGGIKEGTKLGLRLGSATLGFCLFEETVDYMRHYQRDFLSTVTAGLSLSGIYSLLCRLFLPGVSLMLIILAKHDVYTAARATRFGLKWSLVFGLLQDGLESLKGNRPAYVDFLMGNRRSKQGEDTV